MSHRTNQVLAAALSCAVGGCASTPPGPPLEFNKKGEVVFMEGSASWDEDQVMGPLINVSQRGDGSWAGQLNNQILDVSIYPSRAAGANMIMKWDMQPTQTIITASWQGLTHRFELYPDRILFRGPTRSFTLAHRNDWSFGPGGQLRLDGQARDKTPPMPQFGLALLATFLASDGTMRDSSNTPRMPDRNN